MRGTRLVLHPMKTKTQFQFRVDLCDVDGNEVLEHIAGIDDFKVAMGAYQAGFHFTAYVWRGRYSKLRVC